MTSNSFYGIRTCLHYDLGKERQTWKFRCLRYISEISLISFPRVISIWNCLTSTSALVQISKFLLILRRSFFDSWFCPFLILNILKRTHTHTHTRSLLHSRYNGHVGNSKRLKFFGCYYSKHGLCSFSYFLRNQTSSSLVGVFLSFSFIHITIMVTVADTGSSFSFSSSIQWRPR